MKHLLLILSLLFVTGVRLFAQDDDDDDDNEKIQVKMNEYIGKRLDLTKDEAAKFTPVFLRYFREWRQTIRENRGDRLVMQQKIIALRLNYRTRFREIIGERRGDQVFNHQERFIQELRDLRKERLRNNPGAQPLRRNRTNLMVK
jgi:hypothetical protein